MNIHKNLAREDILESIELPKNLDQLVADSVEKGYELMKQAKKRKRAVMVKRAAVIMGIVIGGGLISFPVKAFVESLVQERMEQVPKEELAESLKHVDAQQTEADSCSREYTDGENKRREELTRAYNHGTFPQGELRQEETADESLSGELYFAQDTATFYLPERELTDDEILQIIDFVTKRDYAVTQRYEQEYGAEKKKQEQAAKEEITATGGLTDMQAKELGRDWLLKLYGETGEGMELSFYLDETENGHAYMMGYYLRSIRNCTVYMDAQDGRLLQTYRSVVAEDLDTRVSTATVEEKADILYQKAKEAFTDLLGLYFAYEKVIMVYYEEDGHLIPGNRVSFVFVKPDGDACDIMISAVSNEFIEYWEKDIYGIVYKDGEVTTDTRSIRKAEESEEKMICREMQ